MEATSQPLIQFDLLRDLFFLQAKIIAGIVLIPTILLFIVLFASRYVFNITDQPFAGILGPLASLMFAAATLTNAVIAGWIGYRGRIQYGFGWKKAALNGALAGFSYTLFWIVLISLPIVLLNYEGIVALIIIVPLGLFAIIAETVSYAFIASLGCVFVQKRLASADKRVAANPKDASAYEARGKIRHAGGDLRGGIDDYEKAVRLNGRLIMAYKRMAVAKTALGDKAGAAEANKKFMQLSQSDTGFLEKARNRRILSWVFAIPVFALLGFMIMANNIVAVIISMAAALLVYFLYRLLREKYA